MVKQSMPNQSKPSSRNFIFKIITILLPLIILLLFEGVLRLSGYGDKLSLFVQNPLKGYEKYMIVNPEVGKKYFQKFEYTAPANDTFLKNKKEGTVRIFVMGSSTVFGFPFDRNLMFSRILDNRLKEAYTDKKVEVINTAITAINSYTLLDYGKQIVKYDPDIVLIYAGHNEFYGAFGVGSNETMSRNRMLTQLHIALMDLKIYQLLRNGINGIAQNIANNKNKVHGTLMKRIVANKDILYGSDDYKLAMERYEQNMADLIKMFKKDDVPVFISEVVSNVKDIRPFNSIKVKGEFSANQYFDAAIESEFVGEIEEARKQYKLAKDYDCIRFRASEEVNEIIHKLANQFELNLVPMVQAFEEASPKGLVGDNLMTEHVHPNIAGNFLMAKVFFNQLYDSELIDRKDQVSVSDFDYFKNNYGYTILDSLNAVHNVKQLKSYWPFVKDNNGVSDYVKSYKPKSYIDSAVFSALQIKDVSLSDVRLELAGKFEENKRYDRAFNEYNAMVYSNPYLAINYRDAATNLIFLSDLPLAEKYFLKSLEWEESFYANYKLGEIYLIKSDYNKAVECFQKSYDLASKNERVKVLVKSFMALVYAGRTNDAKTIAKELQKIDKRYLNIPPKKYVYTDYIPHKTRPQVLQAKKYLAENDVDHALKVLTNSLNIYDSHIAKRLIGEIYYRQNNLEQSQKYFDEVYPEFKFDPSFLHQYVLLLAQNKNFVEAKNVKDELKQLEPDFKGLDELNKLNFN